MRFTRLTTISVIYGLKEFLHDHGFSTVEGLGDFPFVKVITKDQAYKHLETNCIVVYPSNQFDRELQLGGGYWVRTLFNFDVYAATDAMLLDLVDLVREYLETDRSVLRYDQSRPTYQVLGGIVRSTYSEGVPAQVCPMSFENRTILMMDRVSTIGESTAHSAQLTTIVTTPNA